MNKPFEELYGNRVYLELPEVPSKNLVLSDEALKQWVESKKLEISHWKVYAVGNNVTHVKEGDEVLVDAMGLMRAVVVPLNKDMNVLAISSMDIAHKWK